MLLQTQKPVRGEGEGKGVQEAPEQRHRVPTPPATDMRVKAEGGV